MRTRQSLLVQRCSAQLQTLQLTQGRQPQSLELMPQDLPPPVQVLKQLKQQERLQQE